MAGYGQIDSSFPERIMRMAEHNLHENHKATSELVRAEAFSARLAAGTTAAVAGGGLVISALLIVAGLPAGALLTALPAILVGIGRVTSAIRGRSSDD